MFVYFKHVSLEVSMLFLQMALSKLLKINLLKKHEMVLNFL